MGFFFFLYCKETTWIDWQKSGKNQEEYESHEWDARGNRDNNVSQSDFIVEQLWLLAQPLATLDADLFSQETTAKDRVIQRSALTDFGLKKKADYVLSSKWR